MQDTVNTLFDLQNQYVTFPTTEAETAECIASFNQTSSELPNVAGAVDGTHIRIIAPRVNPVDFFSRCRQQHDIIVQGKVDGTGKFIDAVAGFPGSLHDARVLRNTSVYHSAEQGDILQVPKITRVPILQHPGS